MYYSLNRFLVRIVTLGSSELQFHFGHYCPCPSMGPKLFGLSKSNLVTTVMDKCNLVQIIKISLEKFNLNLTKVIWTCLKRIRPDQNNLYPPKTIWTVYEELDIHSIKNKYCIITLNNLNLQIKQQKSKHLDC